jgi:DNA-binding MarR family transcriptional regulator
MTDPNSSSPFTSSIGAPLIGALLRMSWEVVQHRMLGALRAAGHDGLEAPHLRVLLFPGPDGLRPSDLAGRLGMTKQALNYLLGELESQGYVERHADLDDLRSKRLALTSRGAEAIRTMRGAVSEVEREWEQLVGAERFATLRGTLEEIAVAARAGGSAEAPPA